MDNLQNNKKRMLVGGAVVFGSLFVITAAICFFWGSKTYDTSKYTDVGDGNYASGMVLTDGQIMQDGKPAVTDIPEADMSMHMNDNGDVVMAYNESSDWSSSLDLLMDCLSCTRTDASSVMEQIYSLTNDTGHACYSLSGIKRMHGTVYKILTGTNRLYEISIDKKYSVILQKEVFDVESWVDS